MKKSMNWVFGLCLAAALVVSGCHRADGGAGSEGAGRAASREAGARASGSGTDAGAGGASASGAATADGAGNAAGAEGGEGAAGADDGIVYEYEGVSLEQALKLARSANTAVREQYNTDDDEVEGVTDLDFIYGDFIFGYSMTADSFIIKRYIGTSGTVAVPGLLAGFPISAIAKGCFKNSALVTSVTLPEGLTKIDAYAFKNCPNLRTVNIPSTITDIGSEAFRTSPLTNATAADGLGTVHYDGYYAFFGCEPPDAFREKIKSTGYISGFSDADKPTDEAAE